MRQSIPGNRQIVASDWRVKAAQAREAAVALEAKVGPMLRERLAKMSQDDVVATLADLGHTTVTMSGTKFPLKQVVSAIPADDLKSMLYDALFLDLLVSKESSDAP